MTSASCIVGGSVVFVVGQVLAYGSKTGLQSANFQANQINKTSSLANAGVLLISSLGIAVPSLLAGGGAIACTSVGAAFFGAGVVQKTRYSKYKVILGLALGALAGISTCYQVGFLGNTTRVLDKHL